MKVLIRFFKIFVCLYSSLFEIVADQQNLDPFANNILPAKEIAIIQLAFDGINTFHCGVGTVILQTQAVLKEFNERYKNNVHFKLYLISADYSSQLPEYSAETLQKNNKDCTESGGRVQLIPISKNDQMFGDVGQWQELCKNGAKLCSQIINENSYTLVIAHDTAYAQLPLHLKELSLKGEIERSYEVVYVPHATSWSYNGHTSEGIAKWPERHQWELVAFQQASELNYKIGYISETIKQDLLSPPFKVPENALIFYRTGILLDGYLNSLSEEVIAIELNKRSIPLDKRLIFSIGRANPLKGHDITLEMYRHLKNFYSDIHLVMLAPPSDYMPSYLQILKDRIKSEKLDVTLIDLFDPTLAHFIYQWPKTEIISLLSRMDTQPLTVMEARTNPKNSIVLVSDPNRMGGQVIDKINGFVCPLAELGNTLIEKPIPLEGSLETLVCHARQILDLSEQEKRNKIIDAGKELILERYDLRKNMISNLHSLLKKTQNDPNSSPVDSLSELSNHSDQLSAFYSLQGPLVFEKLPGGISNAPIAVFSKIEEKKIPLGLFKREKNDDQIAAIRLKILSDIRSHAFPYLPLIFKNHKGNFLTKIGHHFYYFLQFLPADHREPSFEEILDLTGKFHKATQKGIGRAGLLTPTKLDEYLTRSASFFDPWFKEKKPEIFEDPFWNALTKLSQYFNSAAFRSIYEQLPHQLIHGDNNQTNILTSNGTFYLIDFDTVRYDVRLLDLASYFRYGGFEQYLNLTSQKKLITSINTLYGKTSGNLTCLEEKSLHSIVIFSHIEFMAWALEILKQASIDGDQEKEKKFAGYLVEYIDQLRRFASLKIFMQNH